MKHTAILIVALISVGCSPKTSLEPSASEGLTVIAIGDAGESGSALRGNARYVNEMYTGQHDGGRPDVMIFLGDNFYPTGLNIPKEDVEGKIKKILGPFRPTFEALGKSNVHALAGNHDYYARNAIEKSVLFGLISIAAGPVGLTDRGNERERAIEWWTYYYNMPAEVVYPVAPGSRDSVQFIMYDSSLPLRTEPETWTPALDSLRRLLSASTQRPRIVWRVLSQHHPWHSVGEHGGYSVWDDEKNIVTYLTNCDRDSNAVSWLLNTFDPEDLCAPKYQAQLDSLRSVLHETNVRIQLVLAGHEHNLQLLSYPDDHHSCDVCPKVFVVSGAGAKATRTKLPDPPHEYTAAQVDHEGESHYGFAQLRFGRESVGVVFFNASNGDKIAMGGGKREFHINLSGQLLP